MLPEDFEAVAHAKAFRHVEQAQRGCKGTMLQGLGLDAPLSVMSQQRLFVVKYFLQVPECATDDGSRPSARETLMDAARVDLDLPTGEKCSWWRLDGYATCAEPEACEELGAEPEDTELSLSNSEDFDDNE